MSTSTISSTGFLPSRVDLSSPPNASNACLRRLFTDVMTANITLEQAEQVLFLKRLLACGHRVQGLSAHIDG